MNWWRHLASRSFLLYLWIWYQKRKGPKHDSKLTVADFTISILINNIYHVGNLFLTYLHKNNVSIQNCCLIFTFLGWWARTKANSSAGIHPSSSLLNTRNDSWKIIQTFSLSEDDIALWLPCNPLQCQLLYSSPVGLTGTHQKWEHQYHHLFCW